MITVEFADATELLMREVCAHLGGLRSCASAVLRPEHVAELAGLDGQVASLPADLDPGDLWSTVRGGPAPAEALLVERPALRWLVENAFDGPLSRRFTETFDEFPDEDEEWDGDPDKAEVQDAQERGSY